MFRLHRAGLVRLAAFIVGDRGTGEDVVQDVFARVHQRGHPVDGGLLPYLRAAVVNSCRNAVRRRLLIRRHAEKHAPCPPLTTEEAAMLSEDRRQVLAAFTAMPARIAEALRAEGTSIYQTGRVDRQVYEIRAVVQPGDSGGPLLSPSGTVDGMVQQVESGTPDTGFALTASYAQADAKAAASATAPVSTQGCALH